MIWAGIPDTGHYAHFSDSKNKEMRFSAIRCKAIRLSAETWEKLGHAERRQTPLILGELANFGIGRLGLLKIGNV